MGREGERKRRDLAVSARGGGAVEPAREGAPQVGSLAEPPVTGGASHTLQRPTKGPPTLIRGGYPAFNTGRACGPPPPRGDGPRSPTR